ncbi:MAG: type II toxin-antitoxin system prevent-host-death family antitoxin [Chloroflexota bacterium]|nr:type II toxin-antitoxin system prevent-host-death family antitoxin [Chloroflexota bacterium]MDE2970003.1 type II toxin-antitoxin system prevent-host-death family antitoxin [Chloroflexota bacterium]
MATTQSGRVWTVSEAKAKLSEILRLAETEGPQRIGARKTFVVVQAVEWEDKVAPRIPLGQWLVENLPSGVDLELPSRDSTRPAPFADEADGA